MRLWITTALVALLAALLWLAGGQARADAPLAAATLNETTALRYEIYDLTGKAATAGSYAFLPGSDDATGVVATYEGLRGGSATQLLIHKTDAQGTSRAPLYDAIASGAFFEWRKADDCWVRYRVTEVQPDPPGAAPRKLLAVEWTTYAFTGCSGPIAASTAAVIEWGALPDLGGVNLSSPIRHGLFQLAPAGWTGEVEEDPFRPWPGNSYANPVGTAELAEARRLPHWRDPALPSGWTLIWASSGDSSYDPPYGYCAGWANDRGYRGIEICGGFYLGRDRPRESSKRNGSVVVETRVIAGRLAIVEYSPVGPNHNSYTIVRVLVSDPIPDAVYHVRGLDWTLNGSNVDAVIAIARSLFEGADEATAATQGAAGPGESPAPLARPEPLFEWWADGRPTSPPLHLELHSSRELCTAGTLTEISWEVSGGVAPYQISIEGEAVDADADNVRVNCGALTEAEATDAEAALAAKTVSAVVTDSRGIQRTATVEVARARAVRAPSRSSPATGVQPTGAGVEILTGDDAWQPDLYGEGRYLVRHRPAGSSGEWSYVISGWTTRIGIEMTASEHTAQLAYLRHPLEAETPEALNWNSPETYARLKPPPNLRATATHDTVTVRFDDQPGRWGATVRLSLYSPSGELLGSVQKSFHSLYDTFVAPGNTPREVVFKHAPPDSAFKVYVSLGTPYTHGGGTHAETTVRTAPAPPGWTPPPEGPQNLRATATHDSITVRWDPPYEDAESGYLLILSEAETGRSIHGFHPGWDQREWTLRGGLYERLQPNTSYRVFVTYRGIPYSSAEIIISTLSSPSVRGSEESDGEGAAGRGGSPKRSAGQPLFEWWADGRPTSPPLHLKLESSRDLCTAGTLTEVSWTISGGVAPYTLSIEGAAVNVDADNIRINCGALTEAEAADAEAALAAKTVSAVVTDSRGVQRRAALDVDRARALPAPIGLGSAPQGSTALFWWDEVSGAGSQSPPFYRYSGAAPQHRRYLLRHQPTGAATWTYKLIDNNIVTLGLPDGARLVSVAAIRHPLEADTPGVLVWSAPTDHANVTPPTNVAITATHDTITVSWDVQRHVPEGHVALLGPNGVLTRGFQSSRSASRESVRFTNLPPATNFTVRLKIGWFESNLGQITEQIATESAPPGYRPLPAGPQRLQLTATHDSITATWEPPYSGAESLYYVTVFEERTGRKVARRMVHGGATTWTEYGSFTEVQPATTYRVTVRHGGIRGGQAEATATTQGTAGPGESPAPFARPEPLFEWWADGRPASPPLDLKLSSSRDLCTAGTLTEVSWKISGGSAPYALSVENSAVDVSADNVRVNCGALTEAEAGDAEAALAAKTVTATVTDSRGVQRQAALEVQRARALPAPTNVRYSSNVGGVIVSWDTVEGAGLQSATTRPSPTSLDTFRLTGAVRTRANQDGAVWTYHTVTRTDFRGWQLGPTSDPHVLSVAAVRHPLELETPAALGWSDELVYASTTVAQNVTLAATHDTVTISWDRQPYARNQPMVVWLFKVDDNGGWRRKLLREEPGAAARHTVTFAHLSSDTDWSVRIEMHYADAAERPDFPRNYTRHAVRTLPAPADWNPAPAGPQNLRYTQAAGVTSILWDEPYPDAEPNWFLTIDDPATGALWATRVYGTSWTLPAYLVVSADTEYRVTVEHRDVVGGSASIRFRTPPARPAGQAESLAPLDPPKPLFEWWADGRPASPPLDLKLRSSRELCTAGTLTEISWEISGGIAPYTLSIEGAAVDASADNVRVNCGALTEAEAGDAEAALDAKTVNAVVTDSRGVQRQAALDVARARALPAPTPRAPTTVRPTSLHTDWVTIGGAHHDAPIGWWLIRWRPADADSGWNYNKIEQTRPGDVVFGRFGGLSEGSSYTFAVAALRDPIEQLTPDALIWSSELEARTTTTPTGVGATATHDTVTVTWDDQPEANVYVKIIRADGAGREEWIHVRPAADPSDEATFINLEPEAEYDITVAVDDAREGRLSTAAKVTTAAAPTGWQAPPRGAQNLSVTATHDTITVTWDAPVPNTRDRWVVYVEHPSWHSAYNRWVSAPLTFTLEGLSPATTYTVSVVHLDLYGVEVSTTATTADAPKHGHYDQPPLIEWWVDGRPASPPLDLKLESSRELCTAGTLTEVSWQISGGVAPYSLSVEGEAVDVDADNIRINCGALTEAEAGDAEAALAAKRITATVTDSRGVQRHAALEVARARALPAPTNVRRFSQVGEVIVSWDEVDGAGSQSPTIVHSGRSVTGLVRTRANHDGAPWRYHTATRLYADEWVLGPTSGVQVLSVAAVRHPLGVETPDALSWSDDLVYASTTVAQNVTLAATHDTVTVSWDRQPHVGYQQVWVWLSRADNEGGRRWKTLHEELGVAGRHTVIFNGLPADTQLEVVIEMHYAGAAERPDLPSNVTQHTVRTLLAPPGWTPAPVGPQNLRYMQTSGVTTVLWDEPYPDAEPSWFLTIENLATGAIWGTWVSGTAWTLPADLVVLPDTVYLVTVEHADLVSGAASISFRTPPTPPAGQAESLTPPARPKPPFEWWADGRPTSPPLHMKLRSSRELCTAGTLTEVSWTISGGVAPYELSIEGEAVDVDADNIRINCGPLPTDPRTSELLAAQPKTFHASVSDSRGVSTAASVAVTVTTPPYLAADTALRYETYDLTGGAAAAGSYAFLAGGAAGAVATYEGLRDGSATQLLIHTADAQGTSQRSLYDAVASGDLFEWRQSYDCWVRYRVTEVRPDPPGAAPRKQLAVERISYAFSGCTGAIAANATVLLAWGALPDLGGPTLAAPLRHGPFQIVPEGWEGQFEEDPFRPWPGNSYADPVGTDDLAEARQLPHWRDPTLPAGWTLSLASSGDLHSDPPYGYCSWWATDHRYGGVEICGGFYPVQDRPRESSRSNGGGVIETRMIAGRPAIVEYSPAGPNHNPYIAVRVQVYDSISDTVHDVRGLDGTLRGDRVNAGIAITRSLFEEAD